MVLNEDELKQVQAIAKVEAVGATTKKKTRRRNWEANLVYQYKQERYSGWMVWVRNRIGPVDSALDPKYADSMRGWVDFVATNNKEVHLIEFKMKPDVKAYAQILQYDMLFPQTPEFELIRHLPRKLKVVVTRDNGSLRTMCEQQGIEFEVYAPEWTKEYWDMIDASVRRG